MNNSKLIRNYDFAKADFDSLPKEIFQMGGEKLSNMDKAILAGIKYQKTISIYNGIYQTTKQGVINSLIHIRYSALDILPSVPRFAFAGVTFALAGFFLLSLTYYANVNFNLGMKFLTDLFA